MTIKHFSVPMNQLAESGLRHRGATITELPSPPLGKTGWPWTEGSRQLPDSMADGKPWPKISIVTPSYNQSHFIEETIRSVLLQGYPNLEYIIMDGGSTDSTVAIIRKYETYLKYWVSQTDRGQSDAINKGFTRSNGDLLAWLNSDDYYVPGALHKVAEAAMDKPQTGAFVGTCRIVDALEKVTYCKEPPPDITVESIYNWLKGDNFMQPSCVFTRSAWEQCGPLDESIHIAFDVDLWLRMAKKDYRFEVMNILLSTARYHQDAKTTAFANIMRLDIALVIIRHGGEGAVRRHLEQMAQRLSWYEANFWKIMNNPVLKLLYPLIRIFVKPAARWRDTVPNWFGHD